jgi:hypothetical protein
VSTWGAPSRIKAPNKESHPIHPIQELPGSALKDCEALLKLDPDVIRKLRSSQPYLSKITAQDILSVAPTCDDALAGRLCEDFR